METFLKKEAESSPLQLNNESDGRLKSKPSVNPINTERKNDSIVAADENPAAAHSSENKNNAKSGYSTQNPPQQARATE